MQNYAMRTCHISVTMWVTKCEWLSQRNVWQRQYAVRIDDKTLSPIALCFDWRRVIGMELHQFASNSATSACTCAFVIKRQEFCNVGNNWWSFWAAYCANYDFCRGWSFVPMCCIVNAEPRVPNFCAKSKFAIASSVLLCWLLSIQCYQALVCFCAHLGVWLQVWWLLAWGEASVGMIFVAKRLGPKPTYWAMRQPIVWSEGVQRRQAKKLMRNPMDDQAKHKSYKRWANP